MGEEAKIAIRNIRREANKLTDKEQKDGLMTEDEAYKTKETIQKLTKDYESNASKLVDDKTSELMQI